MAVSQDRMFDDATPGLDRFGALLLITVVSIVFQMLIDLGSPADSIGSTIGAISLSAAAGAVVLLAFRASGVRRRWIRVSDAIVGLGIAALTLVLIAGLITGQDVLGPNTQGTPPVLYVVLTAIAPLVVVRRLLQHRSPTASTLVGAVAAYLLIANSFAYAFMTVDSLSATPFFGDPQPTTSFMYFSLVTATTLGYGDLVPVTEMGRLLAVTEAVVGQVFLVTFVAMIVGLIVQERE